MNKVIQTISIFIARNAFLIICYDYIYFLAKGIWLRFPHGDCFAIVIGMCGLLMGLIFAPMLVYNTD